MIQLSQSAITEVLRLKAKRQNSDLMFRLGVRSTGCLGLFYITEFADALKPSDQQFDCNGVVVVVDSESLPYVQGMAVDYSEDLMGGAFRFHNPNANQTCECGNSFSVRQAP